MIPPGKNIVCLFEHTDQGSHALISLLEAGVEHGAISVIGDLGIASGDSGAEHHVTFDALHVPREDRELFMSTIRSGGVVLAVAEAVGVLEYVERIAAEQDALWVGVTEPGTRNPSHNVAP